MKVVALGCALAAVLVVAPLAREAPASATRASSASIAAATPDGRLVLLAPTGRLFATLTRPRNKQSRDWDPAWSPDGEWLAFARTTDDNRSFHVYVVRANGTGARRITNGRFDESPSWSPDGRWIAYAAMDGIRLVRPDGTGRRLVPGTGRSGAGFAMPFAGNPSWTPGGRLAYSFHPEDPTEWPASCESRSSRCGWVLTSRLDGSGRRPIVRGRDAHWSRDGLIVYTPPAGGVATIPAGGGKSRFLGRGYKADWSPDGRRIVFARLGEAPAGDAVWVMNANGSNRRRLFRGASAPAWRPVP